MITFVIFAVLLAIIIYTFVKLRPKKSEPFPEQWEPILHKHVKFYRNLNTAEKKRFKERMMQFLSEVYIDSVAMEIEDLDKILIAASAIIPVFGFKEWHYSSLSGILLYPDNFNADYEFKGKDNNRIIAGMVGTGRLEKKMILSKKALHAGFNINNDKRNTAVHEFVHLIDKMDGITDGVPERLMEHAYTIPWLKLIHEKIEAINNDDSDIRSYGGTNQQEFFAVASEYFFERPKLMRRKHPELYKILSDVYSVSV